MIALCLEPDQLAGKFEPPVVAKFTFIRLSLGSAIVSQRFEVITLETAIAVAVVEGHGLKRVHVYDNICIASVIFQCQESNTGCRPWRLPAGHTTKQMNH